MASNLCPLWLVLSWLRLLHTDLPALVKQRYGTELRSKTLASLKPEILQALDSLLEELNPPMKLRSSELLFNDQANAILPKSPNTKVCKRAAHYVNRLNVPILSSFLVSVHSYPSKIHQLWLVLSLQLTCLNVTNRQS